MDGEVSTWNVSGTMDAEFSAARVSGQKLLFGFLSSLTMARTISAGESVAAQEITVCIERGTPPGQYAMTLEEGVLVVKHPLGSGERGGLRRARLK